MKANVSKAMNAIKFNTWIDFLNKTNYMCSIVVDKPLTNEQVVTLANVIEHHPSLEILSFKISSPADTCSNSLFTIENQQIILDALFKNKKLRFIGFINCELSDSALQYIASKLAETQHIEFLYISEDILSDNLEKILTKEGIIAFVESLKNNLSLRKLVFSNPHIESNDEILSAAKAMLAIHPLLCTFIMSGVFINADNHLPDILNGMIHLTYTIPDSVTQKWMSRDDGIEYFFASMLRREPYKYNLERADNHSQLHSLLRINAVIGSTICPSTTQEPLINLVTCNHVLTLLNSKTEFFPDSKVNVTMTCPSLKQLLLSYIIKLINTSNSEELNKIIAILPENTQIKDCYLRFFSILKNVPLPEGVSHKPKPIRLERWSNNVNDQSEPNPSNNNNDAKRLEPQSLSDTEPVKVYHYSLNNGL